MNLHKYNTKFQLIIKSSFAVKVKNVLGGPYSDQVPYYVYSNKMMIVKMMMLLVSFFSIN